MVLMPSLSLLSICLFLSLSHPLSSRSLSLSLFSALSALADGLSWLWELIDKAYKNLTRLKVI